MMSNNNIILSITLISLTSTWTTVHGVSIDSTTAGDDQANAIDAVATIAGTISDTTVADSIDSNRVVSIIQQAISGVSSGYNLATFIKLITTSDITEVLVTILTKFATELGAALENMETANGDVTDYVKNAINEIVKVILAAVVNIKELIGSDVVEKIDNIKSAVVDVIESSAIEGITNVISKTADVTEGVIDTVGDAVKHTTSTVVDAQQSAQNTITDFVKNIFG